MRQFIFQGEKSAIEKIRSDTRSDMVQELGIAENTRYFFDFGPRRVSFDAKELWGIVERELHKETTENITAPQLERYLALKAIELLQKSL